MTASIPGEYVKRLAQLRELRGPAVPGFTRRVRDLVIIASSSRGGSGMLAELLRHSPDLVHLQGEMNPVLRLAGLAYPDSADSDYLGAPHLARLAPAVRDELETEIALDAGGPAVSVKDADFALAVAWRLHVQWPALGLDVPGLLDSVERTLAGVRAGLGWAPDRVEDPAAFLRALLAQLRPAGGGMDPCFYDLPAGEDGAPRFTGVPRHDGPPGDFLIEEPPFVVPRPWRRAGEPDLAKPLVVKTPGNAYRLGFLRALFPGARVRVLHLTRNPAAAINGLADGWRHHGFHAHRMRDPLRIGGYGEGRPRERMWWKFDLPPGWQDYTSAPLLSVCAFQWRSCHEAILADAPSLRDGYLRVRFENLTGSVAGRVAELARVARWLEIPFGGAFARAAATGVAPVTATRPPAPGRWRERCSPILAAIDASVAGVAAEIGYGEIGHGAADDWV